MLKFLIRANAAIVILSLFVYVFFGVTIYAGIGEDQARQGMVIFYHVMSLFVFLFGEIIWSTE